MKKIMSVLLVLVLLAGMALGGYTATAKINGVSSNFKTVLQEGGDKGLILLDKKTVKSSALSDLAPAPGSELKIYLTAGMFTDASGDSLVTDASKTEYISQSQIRTGKVTLKRTASSGSKAFSSIKLRYDKSGTYISARFADPYVSTKEIDFSTTLYLSVNNKRNTTSAITIAGTLANEVVELYSDMDYVDLSDGQVGEAAESVRSIEVDLGEGLTLMARVSRGKKIYATVSTDLSAADERLMSKYPAIEYVYTLKTLNMTKSGNVASFDIGDEEVYVYNEKGEYLGTSNKMLPYSAKYYLSSRKYKSIALS